ncbi:MAG: hypothetical protein QNK37_18295 [Acidobacteriota bacterium]|nr:hypothetical protein [Acidobacteriota bacterium]
MTLWFALIAMLALSACSNQDEEKAARLYELAETYRTKNQYDKAVQILQDIRIQYENTEYASRAEYEISEYEKLEAVQLQNNARKIQNRFTSIGRALENYKARFLAYPINPKDLEKLPSFVVPDWDDVWGNPIYYKPTYTSDKVARHSPDGYALATFGLDALPGGDGQNQDFFFKNGRLVAQVTDQ